MVAAKISLLDVACRLHLAVAMVDLSLAQRGGLDLKVIATSVHDECTVRSSAMVAGADASVLERAIATDLLHPVDAVHALRGVDAGRERRRENVGPIDRRVSVADVVDESQRGTRSA